MIRRGFLPIVLFLSIALAGVTPGYAAPGYAVLGYADNDRYTGSSEDRNALEKTSVAIRAAFARGDIEGIMAYHHPDVIKALSYNKYLVGRDAVKADLLGTLRAYNMEFTEHRVENLFFQGDTAVEESTFAIRSTPKDGGAPVVFRGRAMVVYVRYKGSPTGWASIREVVQPAT
jgi:ketosteroid isomerase-like protein